MLRQKVDVMRDKELVICGLKAVRSRFETNSDSVKRLFFNRASAVHIGDLCRWMAQERLVYRCVESAELELISGSVHHGGVVVVIEAPALRSPEPDEFRNWSAHGETLLLLDRISNVHNLGAIIRSAAFFGIKRVILPDHPQAALPSDATYRVAEGGLDHVEVFCVEHLPSFIRALRSSYFVVGAATRGGSPEVAPVENLPLALVLGNEEQGLSAEVASVCNELVTIPGSGKIESLNVSAVAAVLLWECTRANRRAPSRNANFRSSSAPQNRQAR
jgi:TrmH RNA methyltransferase